MRRGVWNKTGSICDTGRGGNWPRGNVYGTILTLNGHNFYQNVDDHDELTLSGKILEFQNIVEFVLLFFPMVSSQEEQLDDVECFTFCNGRLPPRKKLKHKET